MTVRLFSLLLFLPLLVACGGADRDAATEGSPGGARYQEGVHYERLARPLDAAANEVVEVFSYACPACGQLQPQIDAWKRDRGDAIVLRYVPAVFNASWEPFARSFHAAQELGALSRVHRAIYSGMGQAGRPVNTLSDLADVVAGVGVDRQRFLDTAQSPAVDAALERSREYVQRAAIESTPTLIVSGRYRVGNVQPGGISPLTVVDWLIEHQP